METNIINPDQIASIWFLCIYCIGYKCTPADDRAYDICQGYFVRVKYVDLKDEIQWEIRSLWVELYEPWHVISSNVPYGMCRLRRACAASF